MPSSDFAGRLALAAALILAGMLAACHARAETVRASWYGSPRYGEHLARRTASGELFRPAGMTAASHTLPLGSRIRVTLGRRTVVVRVSDRGPAEWTGRQLDLSRGAAAALGMIAAGVAEVSIQRIE